MYLGLVFKIALESEHRMGSCSCAGKTSSNRMSHPASNGWYSYLAIDTSVAMFYRTHKPRQLLRVWLKQLGPEYSCTTSLAAN